MSEGHHHGGDAGGQPGFQPGMIPPHQEHHHHHGSDVAGQPGFQPGMLSPYQMHHRADDLAGSSGPMPPGYGRRRSVLLRRGSAAWIVRWILRLVIIAFFVFVAFQLIHGVSSMH